jgi:hypothetical protein
MPQSSKWSLSFMLSHQNPVHFSLLSHACNMPCLRHSWFDLPNTLWWWVQIMKLPIVQLSPFSDYFIPLRSKYSPQQPVLKHSFRICSVFCVSFIHLLSFTG